MVTYFPTCLACEQLCGRRSFSLDMESFLRRWLGSLIPTNPVLLTKSITRSPTDLPTQHEAVMLKSQHSSSTENEVEAKIKNRVNTATSHLTANKS